MKKTILISLFVFSLIITNAASASQNSDQSELQESNEGEAVLEDYTKYFSSRYSDKVDDLDDDIVENMLSPIILGLQLSDVIPNFGDPRGDGTRSHEGQDYVAPRWAPIVSPTDAVVTRISDGANSGLVVYTANPGGERFAYMHLEYIPDYLDEGDELSAGDLIGFVGNSGNASATDPHLHLEIRGDEIIDPYNRFDQDFSNADKAKFINDFWDELEDPEDIAKNLVSQFESELESIMSEGNKLPDDITALLNAETSVADQSATAPISIIALLRDVNISKRIQRYEDLGAKMPFEDLSVGAEGGSVVWLQEFLIDRVDGPAGVELTKATATGYYGSITSGAVLEYQRSQGLPATGNYDGFTKIYIFLKDL